MTRIENGNGFGTDEFNAYMTDVQENQTEEEAQEAREISVKTETDRIFEELEKPGESDDNQPLVKLGQKPSDGTGDFVFTLQGQHGKGMDDTFKHVHKDWMKTGCMTFDDALEEVSSQQKQIKDYKLPLSKIRPIVNDDGQVALEFPDGAQYVPTEKALQDMAIFGKTSGGMLKMLTRPGEHATKRDKNTGDKLVEFERDERDAGLIVKILEESVFRADRVDQNKNRLFRCWSENNTMRTVLSEQYAIVNNMWVLELFQKLIPGGMVSHFKGDADKLACNILIPDTIREEEDSDYGGMVSCGNSEIGTGNIFSQPSVFRSICMNGCIWGSENGFEVKKRHRGEINLDELAATIANNLQKQIPLLSDGIEVMLKSKEMKCQHNGVWVSIRNMFAELGRMWKLSRKETTSLIDHWHKETPIIGDDTRTAFGLQAAVTRFGQTLTTREGRFDTDAWHKFDRIGGEIVTMTQTNWERLTARANSLTEKELEKAFVS